MACFNIQYVMILGWLKSVIAISTCSWRQFRFYPQQFHLYPQPQFQFCPRKFSLFPNAIHKFHWHQVLVLKSSVNSLTWQLLPRVKLKLPWAKLKYMLFVYQVTLLTNYFWINRNLCPFLSVPKGIMHHRPYNNYLLCLFVSLISHYQTQLHCTLTWWSLVDHAKMLGKIGCALCAQWCFAVVMWKVIWWNTIQRNQATCWL